MKRTNIFKSALAVFSLLIIVATGMLGLAISPSNHQAGQASALSLDISKSNPRESSGTNGKLLNVLPSTCNENKFASSYNVSLFIDPIPDQIYNGEEPNPTIVVRNGDDRNKILVEDEDYTVEMTCTEENRDFRVYDVVVTGINDYLGSLTARIFFAIIPGMNNISLTLAGVEDIEVQNHEFATNEEWVDYVKNNLKVYFVVVGTSYKLPIEDWEISRCYIDTNNRSIDSDGTTYVAAVLEIYPSNHNYRIVKNYIITYTGELPQTQLTQTQTYYSFPIIMACSILGAVFVSAMCYYIVSAIKNKTRKKTD